MILYEMVYGRAPFSSEYDDEEIKSKVRIQEALYCTRLRLSRNVVVEVMSYLNESLQIVNHRYELKLYKRVPVADGNSFNQ